MTNNTMVLIVHFDYVGTHEYMVYRIRLDDCDAARSIIENTPERWTELDYDCDDTYEDVIDKGLTSSNIWFEKDLYDAVRIVDI